MKSRIPMGMIILQIFQQVYTTSKVSEKIG